MSEEKSSSEPDPSTEKNAAGESRPALVRAPMSRESQAKIRHDLERVFTENLLAQTDVGDTITRDLAAADMSLPSLAQIDHSLGQLQGPEPTQEEIMQLLSLDNVGSIAVDGMHLNELLNGGITGAEERKMLKRGLLFLKQKMYAEATEWWLLNRPEDELTNSRLHLLLTLFLVLTYKLSGDEVAAQTTLLRARSSRLFKRST